MTQSSDQVRKEVNQHLDFANQIADRAREIARRYHRRKIKQWNKPNDTWVTEADLLIEKMAREMVTQHYPEHGFFGEEFKNSDAQNPYQWVLDPIDGTMSFVYGLPTFGVLIALTVNAEPIVGIIESPAMKQRWCGARHATTMWQGQPCRANAKKNLASTAVFATSIDMFSDEELDIFNRLCQGAKERRFGVDCYAYGLLASGFVDVVMEAGMKPYDLMALVPVVEGAGGVISDWTGAPLRLHSSQRVLATSSRKLHDECLELIHSD